MAQIPVFPVAILLLCFIAFSQASSAASKPTGLSMKLIRTDLLFPGNLITTSERITGLIQHSAGSFSSLNQSEANVRLPIRREWKFNYVVELKIGSQHHPVMLLMDTGSSLTWTQCMPCRDCYKQKDPIYNSLTSKSYRKLPCTHQLCQGGNRQYTCRDKQCVYDIRYGDQSKPNPPSTNGVLSFESFQFPVDNVHTTDFNDMIFGCSNDNQNLVTLANTRISGILGLGWGAEGLPSQLAKRGIIGNRFSYCLVPFLDESRRPTILRFGDDIPHPIGPLQSTPLVKKTGHSLYYLQLIDISVGTQRLGFQANRGMFNNLRPDGTGGTFIDSGSVISTIDSKTIGRNAFREVIVAFQTYYDRRRYTRKGGQMPEGFELCYVNNPMRQDFASMTLHFSGGDYLIDAQHMIYRNFTDGYFCVALLESSVTILGIWQQQNKRIIYDLNLGRLQWVTETCANDHSP